MLDTNLIEKIEKALIEEKNILTQKAASDRDIEIDVDGDEFDEIQGNLLIEINNKLNSRNILKLNKINEALNKISLNIYGICEDCGDNIPYKRLLFNPHITTCVSCAEERELEETQNLKK